MTIRGSENQFVQAYLTAFRLDPFDFMYRVQGEVVAAEGPNPAQKIAALDTIFKAWRDVKGDPGKLFLSLGTLKREDIPTATKADLSAEQKALIKAGDKIDNGAANASINIPAERGNLLVGIDTENWDIIASF